LLNGRSHLSQNGKENLHQYVQSLNTRKFGASTKKTGTSSISMETSLIKSAPANQHQDSATLTNRVEVETNCYLAPVIVIFPRLSLATSLTEFN